MDFSYLTNNFEVLRNEVIEVNEGLHKVSRNLIQKPNFYLYSENFKKQEMLNYLNLQNRMNNLYRENITY